MSFCPTCNEGRFKGHQCYLPFQIWADGQPESSAQIVRGYDIEDAASKFAESHLFGVGGKLYLHVREPTGKVRRVRVVGEWLPFYSAFTESDAN